MSMTEEEVERENLLKGLYQPCKKWYNTAKCKPLKTKYGTFPSHWKELADWEHIKLIQRMYFHVTEKLSEGVKQKDLNLAEIEDEILNKMSGTHKYEEGENGNGEEADGKGGGEDGEDGEDGEVAEKVKVKVEAGDTNGDNTIKSEPSDGNGATTIKVEPGTGDGKDSTIKEEKDKPLRKKVPARADSGWEAVNSLGLPDIPGLTFPTTILSLEQYHQCTTMRKALKHIEGSYERLPQQAAEMDARPDRSPSPPPIYDSEGKRVNTREYRMREALNSRRNEIIDSLIKLNPNYKPPADFDRSKNKPQRKVYVPVKEFPNYNFIGLIIGPRGNTQREMEKATNCRISVRGKGSVKEGSQGRNTREVNQAEADDLHVLITGETMEGAIQAEEMVRALLKPLEDQDNTHKMNQLRQLAVINGTLREDDFCAICGEKGHKQYECPQRAKGLQSGVKCKYCGEISHPSRDCPQQKQQQQSAAVLDSAYSDFMAELDGGDAYCQPVTTTTTSTVAATTSNGSGSQGTDPGAPPQKKQKVIVMDMLTGLVPSSTQPSNQYGGGGAHYGGGSGGSYGPGNDTGMGRVPEAAAHVNRRGQAQLPAWMTAGKDATSAPAPAPTPSPATAPSTGAAGRANTRGQQQLPAWMTEGTGSASATTTATPPADTTAPTPAAAPQEQQGASQPVMSVAQQLAAQHNAGFSANPGPAGYGATTAATPAAMYGASGDAAAGGAAGSYDYNNMTTEQWNEAYAAMTPEQQQWYNYQYQYQQQQQQMYAQQYQQYYGQGGQPDGGAGGAQ